MKSGTFTNNTSFSATAAQVNIPTGTFNCNDEYNTITVPNGVTVLKVEVPDCEGFCTVGVTPGKTYERLTGTENVYDDGYTLEEIVERDNAGDRYPWAYFGEEGVDPVTSIWVTFTLKYSPQINTLKPDYTDY